MKVVTDIQRSDLFRVHLHFLPRLKGNWLFVATIALAVIAYAAYSSSGPFTGKKLGIAVFSGLVGGLAGLLIATTVNFLGILRASTKQAGVLGNHEYEIKPDGLFESTSANEQLCKWSGIAAIEKTSSFILIRINDYLIHIIPKRSFSSEPEYEEFFRKLRNSWRPSAA